MSKIPLIGLKANHFRHPLDLQATQSLQQIPGLDILVRNLFGQVAEPFFYLNNIAASVLVGEQQLPHLHKLLLEASHILDLEPPQVYIKQHPQPNAYTFAMRGRQPFLVLHTSLVDLLTPEELQAVIAHELGHLKCEHSTYITIANLVILAAELLPTWGGVLAQQLREQMLEWLRCAELTCDRAALLAVQDAEVVASVLMKLAGGSPTLAPLLNVEAFLEQARAYDAVSATELGQALKVLQTQPLTHPLPVLRAREIDRWANSPQYQKLLQITAMGYDQEHTKGGWRNW